MDRALLKSNAKKIMSKNHMMCVAVAFLAMLSGAGASSGGVSFNFNLNTNNTQTSPDSFISGGFDFSGAVFFFVAMVLVLLISIAIGYVLNAFVFNQLHVGGIRYFLKMRKNNPVEINELFQSYKDKTYLNVAKTVLTRDVNILLWTCVFIIPGIIKTYEYMAVNYILSVRPDMDRKEALALSTKIMDGHKFEYFVLELSFFGWDLLSVFTCMLLSIFYVNPYKMITRVEFFSAVREDAIAKGIITPYDIPDYCEFMPDAPFINYGAQPTYANPDFAPIVNPEPVTAEPVVTEPVAAEPVVTEPVVTEPVVTEPVVTETEEATTVESADIADESPDSEATE